MISRIFERVAQTTHYVRLFISIGLLLCSFFQSQLAIGSIYVMSAGSDRSLDQKTKQLEFAAKDAANFAKTMAKVGSVPSSKITTKTNVTLAEFEQELTQLKSKINNDVNSQIGKFIFFFSGHADERGLHFVDGYFSKNSLDKFLASLAIKTKVIIIDSCFAGLLSSKGIKSAPGFGAPNFNFDEPSGSIFLTASSNVDLAFESRKIRGGLFTNNLINGLNGQADSNDDGIVTASELYEFTFRETQLASRLLPVPTIQKPEFVSNLKGRGAVAMSFPAKARGDLRLTNDLEGQISLFASKGLNSFDHSKNIGQDETISIPTGSYQVQVLSKGRVGQSEIKVASNSTTFLTSSDILWNKPISTDVLSPQVLSRGGSQEFSNPADSISVAPKRYIGASIGFMSSVHLDSDISYAKISESQWVIPKLSLSLLSALKSGNSEDNQYPEWENGEFNMSPKEPANFSTLDKAYGLHVGMGAPLLVTDHFGVRAIGSVGLKYLKFASNTKPLGTTQMLFPATKLELSADTCKGQCVLCVGYETVHGLSYMDEENKSSPLNHLTVRLGSQWQI